MSLSLLIPPPPRVCSNTLAAIAMIAKANTTFVTVVGKLQRSQITWFHTWLCAGGKRPLGVLHLMLNKQRPRAAAGEQPAVRNRNSPHLGSQQYFGWVVKDENGTMSSWRPVTSRCPGSLYEPAGIPCCTWNLKGTTTCTVLTKTGPQVYNIQRYFCSTPGHMEEAVPEDGAKRPQADDPDFRDEVVSRDDVFPTTLVFKIGRTTMTGDLLSWFWGSAWGTYASVTDLRRFRFFMWHSHLENHMFNVHDAALPELITRSELLEEKIPDIKTMRRMLYAIWSVRYRDTHIVHDSVLDDEAGILHWDFTYQAVANIFVQHNGKLVELAYVLGTLFGFSWPCVG